MIRILSFLGKFAPQAMATGVFIGLLLPVLSEFLRPLLPASVWVLLVLSLLRIKFADVKSELSRPALPVAVVVWMLCLAPFLVSLIVWVADFRPGIEAGMVLAAASSSLFSTPVLGVMFGLNGALLLVVLIIGTLLVPLTLPTAALLLLGFDMGAEPLELMLRLAVFVVTAVIAAALVRRVFGLKRIEAVDKPIDGVSVVLLVIFAIGVMEGLGARFISETHDTLIITALSFAVYGGLIMIGALGALVLLGKSRRRDALSVGFISGTRNLAIIIAVLPPGADPDIGLFFAVGQFPIYIMPMLLGPVFRRLLKPG